MTCGSSRWAGTSAASGTGTAIPGIQCDNEAYCYIPLLEELDFMPTKKFADGAEIYEHCRASESISVSTIGAIFSTQVRALRWDESIKRWRFSTNRGDDIRARFVVMASGLRSTGRSCPASPVSRTSRDTASIPSRWDYDYTGGDCQRRTGQAGRQAGRARRHRCDRRPDRAAPRPRRQAPLRVPAHAVIGGRARQRADRPAVGRSRCSRAGRRSASATSTAWSPFEGMALGRAGSGLRLLDRTGSQH